MSDQGLPHAIARIQQLTSELAEAKRQNTELTDQLGPIAATRDAALSDLATMRAEGVKTAAAANERLAGLAVYLGGESYYR